MYPYAITLDESEDRIIRVALIYYKMGIRNKSHYSAELIKALTEKVEKIELKLLETGQQANPTP